MRVWKRSDAWWPMTTSQELEGPRATRPTALRGLRRASRDAPMQHRLLWPAASMLAPRRGVEVVDGVRPPRGARQAPTLSASFFGGQLFPIPR